MSCASIAIGEYIELKRIRVHIKITSSKITADFFLYVESQFLYTPSITVISIVLNNSLLISSYYLHHTFLLIILLFVAVHFINTFLFDFLSYKQRNSCLYCFFFRKNFFYCEIHNCKIVH